MHNCSEFAVFPSLKEIACSYWWTWWHSSGESPKCWNLLCSFPRGCSSIARMTLLSKTKYRKLCLFMVGSLEYLIKVVSFTRLQGEAGPLGEGNAPSNCIILWRIQKITVNSKSKILSLPHVSMCPSALVILIDPAMLPLHRSDLLLVVDAFMCCPDCHLHWKIHSHSCRKMVVTTFSLSLPKRCPWPTRTTSPKITATSWDSPYPMNGWCRGTKCQSPCPNFRELWRANSVPVNITSFTPS